MEKRPPLFLASGSPRRRDLLATLKLDVIARGVDAEESLGDAEKPKEYLERVVEAKLQAARRKRPDVPICATLVADTIVVVDDDILCKPVDVADAALMLRRLVGRTHQVMTRYAVSSPRERVRARTVTTEVRMREANAAEIERYAQTGEGLDKAGAYAAQGVGSFLLREFRGSYSNVVGLPLCEVVEDLIALDALSSFP